MPMSLVRWTALLVFLLGGTMLLIRGSGGSVSGSGYDTLRLVHIVAGLGLLGLYEASMARSKRAGVLSDDGKRWGLAGRISLTLALIIGLFLLLSYILGWLTGDAFSIGVYIHALVGIIAVAFAALVFWRTVAVRRQN